MTTAVSVTANNPHEISLDENVTLNLKATFRADDKENDNKENDKAPDFRILAGASEF